MQVFYPLSKSRLLGICFLVSVCGLLAASPLLAQSTSPDHPTVPTKLELMGMKLYLSKEAQAKIQEDVNHYTESFKAQQTVLERADKYFPLIEKKLNEAGVPDEFKFVTLVESKLVGDVKSKYGTVGFWQFKDMTARGLGLRVDELIDERMNLAASSEAAAELLKQNNKAFNNWIYALQAYNQGVSGAKKNIDPRYVGKSEMNITKNTHHYILHFLAHYIVYNHLVDHNSNPAIKIKSEVVSGVSFKELAKKHNVDQQMLMLENPWLLSGEKIPNDKLYFVHIPIINDAKSDEQEEYEKIDLHQYSDIIVDLDTRKVNILNQDNQHIEMRIKKSETQRVAYLQSQKLVFKEENGKIMVKARPGDTKDELGLAGGISRQKFIRLNNMEEYDLLIPDQFYQID